MQSAEHAKGTELLRKRMSRIHYSVCLGLTEELLLCISAGCEAHFISHQTTRSLVDYHEAAECPDVKNQD